MKTNFQISLHLKTPSGFNTYGSFDLGDRREQALSIFNQLQGTPDVSEKSILYMDLYEMRDGIPFPIEIRHCTLEDIVYNCRIITREVFKNSNL